MEKNLGGSTFGRDNISAPPPLTMKYASDEKNPEHASVDEILSRMFSLGKIQVIQLLLWFHFTSKS